MAYQANKPAATDALSQSQIDIQNNFGAIQTLVDVDHVDFASSDQGKHNKVTFPVQGSSPSFSSGQLGLYSLLNGTTAQNELYFTNAAGTTYPVSASQTTGTPTATSGWTYLGSGMKIVWGQAQVTSSGTVTVSYSTVSGFPGFTSAVMLPQLTRILASATTNNTFVTVAANAAPDLLTFRVFTSNGMNGVIFGWMTIGK